MYELVGRVMVGSKESVLEAIDKLLAIFGEMVKSASMVYERVVEGAGVKDRGMWNKAFLGDGGIFSQHLGDRRFVHEAIHEDSEHPKVGDRSVDVFGMAVQALKQRIGSKWEDNIEDCLEYMEEHADLFIRAAREGKSEDTAKNVSKEPRGTLRAWDKDPNWEALRRSGTEFKGMVKERRQDVPWIYKVTVSGKSPVDGEPLVEKVYDVDVSGSRLDLDEGKKYTMKVTSLNSGDRRINIVIEGAPRVVEHTLYMSRYLQKAVDAGVDGWLKDQRSKRKEQDESFGLDTLRLKLNDMAEKLKDMEAKGWDRGSKGKARVEEYEDMVKDHDKLVGDYEALSEKLGVHKGDKDKRHKPWKHDIPEGSKRLHELMIKYQDMLRAPEEWYQPHSDSFVGWANSVTQGEREVAIDPTSLLSEGTMHDILKDLRDSLNDARNKGYKGIPWNVVVNSFWDSTFRRKGISEKSGWQKLMVEDLNKWCKEKHIFPNEMRPGPRIPSVAPKGHMGLLKDLLDTLRDDIRKGNLKSEELEKMGATELASRAVDSSGRKSEGLVKSYADLITTNGVKAFKTLLEPVELNPEVEGSRINEIIEQIVREDGRFVNLIKNLRRYRKMVKMRTAGILYDLMRKDPSEQDVIQLKEKGISDISEDLDRLWKDPKGSIAEIKKVYSRISALLALESDKGDGKKLRKTILSPRQMDSLIYSPTVGRFSDWLKDAPIGDGYWVIDELRTSLPRELHIKLRGVFLDRLNDHMSDLFQEVSKKKQKHELTEKQDDLLEIYKGYVKEYPTDHPDNQRVRDDVRDTFEDLMEWVRPLKREEEKGEVTKWRSRRKEIREEEEALQPSL